MKRLLFAAWLSLLVLAATARPAEGAERLVAIAVHAADPIHVDGVLNEPDWERAPPITALRLIFVREGEAPSESTDVRVLFDDSRIYFGIRCANQSPGQIRASLAPRDQVLDGDSFIVHLDTYHDLHRAYVFGVNPYGVQVDGVLDGQEPDFNWDAVWDAETKRDDRGWTAELAIPLRAMRFPAGGGGSWGMWIRREITKNAEVCSWPVWREAEQGDIMLQAGDLVGLTGLGGGGGLEAQPYVSSASSATRTFDGFGASTPWDRETTAATGLDLKYGLTSTLTLDGTVNPDYSQIEADALQIDVNQRFPLFFPEKRPFFLEGAEIFTTPAFNLVYTRRIADPSFGTKLTGKAGRWRVGAIAVRDDGGGSSDGIGGRETDAPLRQGYFGIGRARYDIGENSNVGFTVTDHLLDRLGDVGTGTQSYFVPNGGHNAVASADSRLRLGRSLFFDGQFAGSWTSADSSLNGSDVIYSQRFSDVLYHGGLRWNDGTTNVLGYHDYVGPDFRTEAGFLERVDARSTGYDGTYTFRPKHGPLRTWQPQSNGDVIHDSQGALQERRLAGAVEWSFHGQNRLHTRYAHLIERWLAHDYERSRYILEYENTYWRPLAVGFFATLENGIYYADTDADSYLGWQESYTFTATARPDPRLTSEVNVTRNRFSRSRGGAEVFDVVVVGAKTTYQFTRRLYARVYPQYDTDANHLDADALVGYVLHPGSVLYLGINGDVDKIGNRHRTTGRTAFLKASYLFQL